MADNTKIEWTDATWNPITGCSIVSPGCTNCYAMKLAGTRLRHHPTREGLTKDSKAGPVWTGEVRFNERQLLEPLGWKRPRTIFVCAHGDLFHESVPDAWIDRVFAVMALTPHHTYQVLTKRPERMRDYVAEFMAGRRLVMSAATEIRDSLIGALLVANSLGIVTAEDLVSRHAPLGGAAAHPLPNVWLGTSVEDQRRADDRIPHLLQTHAAVRFISAEPLLGPIDLTAIRPAEAARQFGFEVVDSLRGIHTRVPMQHERPRREPTTGIAWVIVGGESGPGARPMHPEWARSLRDQCHAAGVAFFFKQWGAWAPGTNVTRHQGVVRVATWWNDDWFIGEENLARDDGHADDQPDLYEVGKKAAGRLLDGVEHSAMPEVTR